MNKLYFIFLSLVMAMLFRPVSSPAQGTLRLGDSAFASLITCAPGDEFYECFGHSALRICDSSRGLDIVFNYGIFSFDQPFFYLKFAHGSLKYQLAVQRFDHFLFEYDYYGRAVYEHRILLSHDELLRLYAALADNAKPENKYYSYDFFRDNCATRVDHMIDAALDSNRHIRSPRTVGPTSYRDLLHRYNPSMPWWQLGTDILLGARCDRPISAKQLRFIPSEMMSQYDTLRLSDGSPLAAPMHQVLPNHRAPLPYGISPTIVMWLLFVAVAALSLVAQRKGWKLYWLDLPIFFILSSISLLLLFLWFGSDHWCTKWNLNLLWANPLFLWPLFRLRKPRKADCLPLIFILLFTLAAWPFGLQKLNAAVLPIILIIIARLSVRLSRVCHSSNN